MWLDGSEVRPIRWHGKYISLMYTGWKIHIPRWLFRISEPSTGCGVSPENPGTRSPFRNARLLLSSRSLSLMLASLKPHRFVDTCNIPILSQHDSAALLQIPRRTYSVLLSNFFEYSFLSQQLQTFMLKEEIGVSSLSCKENIWLKMTLLQKQKKRVLNCELFQNRR